MTESFPARVPREHRRSNPVTLTVVALGSLGIGALGAKAIDTMRINPLELSSVVATDVQFMEAPGAIPGTAIINGAQTEVAFSSPSAVKVSDALKNIQDRFYADTLEHDAVVGFNVPEGRYVYKVQCESGGLLPDTRIESATFTCGFPIYEVGFKPNTD